MIQPIKTGLWTIWFITVFNTRYQHLSYGGFVEYWDIWRNLWFSFPHETRGVTM